jgi:hypothetical protein
MKHYIPFYVSKLTIFECDNKMLKSVFKILPLKSFVVCLCKGNITNAIGNHKGHINLYLMLINNMFQNST